eukprot:CAMPEP_0117763546 /NCGR_PEP_ID=MMETSP0947-20121206/18731_1 /TAXON_ID=44440 /ORGANISM="Chattonella subsalsa, Strain CCMP2191" /LENGTH=546 /DNA_ID=CAMNT_0005585331 /DNA_START=221 /DNA_END=1862 /DNA_ORIENTATION=-
MHPSLRKSLKYGTLPEDCDPLASINPYENPKVDEIKLQYAMQVDAAAEANRDEIAEHIAWENAAIAPRARLKLMCRSGVLVYLRVGVWLKSVFFGVDFAGTERHLSSLEADWKFILEKVFQTSDEEIHQAPNFGGNLRLHEHLLSTDGYDDAYRVLCCLQHCLAVEYCPVLTDLVPICLTFMPPSCAFAIVQEVVKKQPDFFPANQLLMKVWLLTFKDLVALCFPKTASYMAEINADADSHLIDSLFIEGSKILFRYGLGLISLFKRRLKRIQIADGAEFWDQVREFASDEDFTFQALHRAAFGRFRGQPLTRSLIESLHQKNEMVVQDQSQRGTFEEEAVATRPFRCLGEGDRKSRLLAERTHRSHLASWVPRRYRHKDLNQIFSTDIDGYNLQYLYDCCGNVAPNVLIVEALEPESKITFVVGAYSSHSWCARSGGFGNEECFLFALVPEHKVLRWTPLAHAEATEEAEKSVREVPHFLMATPDFMGMGFCAKTSGFGLLLNKDLQAGSTQPSELYGNRALFGSSIVDFEILTVEVFSFRNYTG